MAELTEADRAHLRRCVELARGALDAGDEPFGSVLVAADGTALAEGRNRVVETGDATQHPEIELARWAAAHLTPEQRAGATVYTSGEHCAMCAAAHGWVGLGRIVYASSSAQLVQWLSEAGAPAPPVLPLPVQQVAPGVVVQGPADDLAEQVRELQLEHSRASAAEGRRSGRRDALCQQRQVRRVVGVELGADGRHLRTHPGQQHLVHVLEHCRDGAFLCAPGGAGALVRRLPGQRQQEAAEPGVLLLRLLFIP